MSNSEPVKSEVLLRQLNWRYAVKKFDPSRRISAADWRALEEALVLSPSSWGIQPWMFVVVDDPAVRAQLVSVSWGQRQVVDASHLVVFAIKKGLAVADVDRYLARIADVRGVPPSSLDGFRKVLVAFLEKPGFDVDGWSAKQLYIALGQFMTAAAMLGIDTCPMEGLDPAAYDRILGLAQQGYATYCACPAGYRAADDRSATAKKVRFALGDVVRHV